MFRFQTVLRRGCIPAMVIVMWAAITCGPSRTRLQKNEGVRSSPKVAAIMKNVCEWQLAHPVEINNQNWNLWARAAFYAGVMAAYRATNDQRYLQEARRWSESREWKLGERPRHADDQSPGQTYLELYLIEKEPVMLAHTQSTIDAMMNDSKPGREDWWWCDALFMAPPVLARLYAITGDKKYIDYLNAMWWDTTDFLFDREAGLYYRDKEYIGKLNPNGKKIFWARGNGWVMAGTARVLQYLPRDHETRARFVELLRTMAATVARQQGEDGLWRPSLLDPEEVPFPETSSSGFFCYALAWGINAGVLDRTVYLPVVEKAWQALVGAVQADGKLGWVQPIGAAPAQLTMDNYQEYGAGAFLLAASEMYQLE